MTNQSSTGINSPNIISEGNVEINYGLSLKEFEKALKQQAKTIRLGLEKFHQDQLNIERSVSDKRLQDITILELELNGVQSKLDDLDAAYKELLIARTDSDKAIELLRDKIPEEQVKLVKEAIHNKSNDEISQAFKEIVNSSSPAIAEAAFQAAKLDEINIHYLDACKYFHKAVMLEDDNPLYLHHYASIVSPIGDYRKSIEYYELALACGLKTYGKDHPDVATLRNNLGNAYDILGDYPTAIEYYELALASDLKAYGENHPKVASRRNNLGGTYKSLGEYAKAIEYFLQALVSDLKTYGEAHPTVAIRRNNLGSTYYFLSEYTIAIEYFDLVLVNGLQTYGEEHPQVALYRNNIGSAYKGLGEYTKALIYYEQALASDLKTYGEDHPQVALYRNNIGKAYESLGEYTKAIIYYEQALASDLRTYGEDHPRVAKRRMNIGGAYHSFGDYLEAIEPYKLAYKAFSKTLPFKHEYNKSLREKIKDVEAKLIKL